MYEYTIHNVNTNEGKTIFGYSWKDAIERCGLKNPDEWEIDFCDYID